MRRKRLATLLLVPLFLSGCSALGLSSSSGSSSSSSAAGATPSPGASWIVVARGSATPSPTPSFPSASPTPTTGTGFLPVGGGPAAGGTPTPTCSPNTFKFSKVGGATAVPGTTSAVVSWYNVGGYNLVQFRLTAISQDLVGGWERDVGWVIVAPTTQCGQMSATITGLDRKTGYVFSVDAVVKRRSGDGTHAATIARTGVVDTL
jgi:hypothetical protein